MVFRAIMFRSTAWGAAASGGMALFYAAIMLVAMPPKEAWLNFFDSWYLIVGIIAGFGTQVGLWVFLKRVGSPRWGGTISGTSGAMSGTAMVACCAHHVADVLPILGLSGAAIFLAQYQRPLLVAGLAINLFGVAYMVRALQKRNSIAGASATEHEHEGMIQ